MDIIWIKFLVIFNKIQLSLNKTIFKRGSLRMDAKSSFRIEFSKGYRLFNAIGIGPIVNIL